MARSTRLRLADMREAIEGIQKLTSGVSFETFSKDWAMQRAVERGLEILSEASRHLPGDYQAAEPDIPWRQIAALGNLLRHEYQRTDSALIWNIVVEHLQRLREGVDRLSAIASGAGSP